MAPHSCLRLLRKISGFTNCPHPYKDDGKGGCIEKESANLRCDPPQFQCGDDCCEIPLGFILIIILLFLTLSIIPLLRSRANKVGDNNPSELLTLGLPGQITGIEPPGKTAQPY
jgi:hypothetical protein